MLRNRFTAALITPSLRSYNQLRTLATEARLSDWGFFPDTARRSIKENTELNETSKGLNEQSQPQIIRLGVGTQNEPNIVPMHGQQRLMACTCSPSEPQLHYMMLEKGSMQQCQCGYWFKGIDFENVTFVKDLTHTKL